MKRTESEECNGFENAVKSLCPPSYNGLLSFFPQCWKCRIGGYALGKLSYSSWVVIAVTRTPSWPKSCPK